MTRVLIIICFMTLCFSVSSALASDKIVVIPLFKTKIATTICTAPDEVKSAGNCWKDRNLGANRAAAVSADSAAYGDLYQWGRLGEGHQNRTSSITAITSLNDVPGHSDFITVDSSRYDWRFMQNDNLWQGLGGINNPCPQGFRLPTETELNAERISWTSGNNAAGAFASPLKLVVAGYRSYNGVIYGAGTGFYWSSTVNGTKSRYLYFDSGNANIFSDYRAHGLSVRCLKD